MRFNGLARQARQIPVFWRFIIPIVAWLIIISWLHCHINLSSGGRKIIRMGYMPVISNLAVPLLDHVSKESEALYFQAIKFSSFAEMAEALRNDDIQVAFMIAPLAIVLRQQGTDVKVVYIGNRHESTLVVRKGLAVTRLQDLAGKTVAVPMRYSGHNISMLQLIDEFHLQGKVNVVEMNPPDMASALASGALDAYYVGEPFAAQTLKSGDAKLLYYVEDVWQNFICNLALVKQSLIDEDPKAVALLVQGAARSGLWASQNPLEAAKIACMYWNQPRELVVYALTTPPHRIVYDRFVPDDTEMQHLTDLMQQYNLIQTSSVAGLVENRFAVEVDTEDVTDIYSILPANS